MKNTLQPITRLVNKNERINIFRNQKFFFLYAIKQDIPILFIVKIKTEEEIRGAIYFILKGNKQSSLALESHESYLSQFCMIVSEETESIYSLSTESLKKYTLHVLSVTPLSLILANTAMHPQYTGKRLNLLRDNPFLLMEMEDNIPSYGTHEMKWLEMKNLASREGCSKEKLGTFFLRHIYASKVDEELNKLHLEYGDFLYDDLRTPLTSLLSGAHLLAEHGEELDAAVKKELIDILPISLDRLLEFINDTLSFG